MKKLIISGTGFPGTNKTLRFLNESAFETMQNVAAICGDKTILSGMIVTGTDVSDGWISYNGESVYFAAGTLNDGVTIAALAENANYNDDSGDPTSILTQPAYLSKTAAFSALAEATFAYADLVRLKTIKELSSVPSNVLTFLRKGSVQITEVGVYIEKDVPFATVGTAAYTVSGSLSQNSTDNTFNDLRFTIGNKTATGFKVIITGMDFAGPDTVFFDYILTPTA